MLNKNDPNASPVISLQKLQQQIAIFQIRETQDIFTGLRVKVCNALQLILMLRAQCIPRDCFALIFHSKH